MSTEQEERLLTVDNAAQRINVSDKTIRRWIREGHLPCTKIGPAQRIRIKPSDLAALMHATNGDGSH